MKREKKASQCYFFMKATTCCCLVLTNFLVQIYATLTLKHCMSIDSHISHSITMNIYNLLSRHRT